ncbi:hypothetical protein CINS5915_00880 [Campylobacter insulaenigrae]|uniref:Uncharacterized protein n=2 Tax=Campylobacter insulaenigrae TaxID=260714 RepID=A0A0A8H202_9BACT|nr:hypothetical protein [Campylobacter insulaenigrae]AJC87705.1 hypothetical protein CINS_0737 [Campylobacter insulaenigrae NCTC 12927]MCR6570098.1 hypothetical protein [Campylobacter insulaenigrae]MCR6571883.1 hypothetical protein [Campylobacter insulaenigrae]MCR6573141.1 hypothetical protein [Campylobacter insulaenigrae]MCR6574928.1 hypothetical protein [Campylobacter insulaenigrae]
MNENKWIDEFKLAVYTEDIEKIAKLIEKPDFKSYPNEALALTKEAIALMKKKQDELASNLQKLQKASAYIK